MATTLTLRAFFRLGERSLAGRLGGGGAAGDDVELSMLERMDASMWMVTGLVRGGTGRIFTGID